MKQRKRRLCTTFLCAVLIATNVFSTCLPVYAKTPNAYTTNESGSVEELTELPTDSGSESIGSNENTDGSSDNNDNDGNTDGSSDSSDNTENNDGSSDSNDNDGNNDGSSDSNDNTGNNDGSSDSSDNTGNNDDSSDSSDNTENNDGSSDSSDNTGNNDGSSDSNDNDGNNDGSSDNNDSDDGNDDSSATPGDSDDGNDDNAVTPGDNGDSAPETPSVSDNDVEPEPDGSSLSPVPFGNAVYPTEDPYKYAISDIEMKPESYSATFSAVSDRSAGSEITILYTTDETNEFFKGTSHVTAEELSASGITVGSFIDWENKEDWDSEYDKDIYRISATFRGEDKEDALHAETTYYYRLAYKSGDYYFLTIPASFTTGPALTETSAAIKDISVEETGYQSAKIVWTIDNPDQLPLSNIRLNYTDDTGAQSEDTTYYSPYRDADNKIVPGKYYAVIRHRGSELPWMKKACVTLESPVGAADSVTVESAKIDIPLKDINDSAVELSVTTNAGTSSFQAAVSLSPCYSLDSSFPVKLYYRKQDDGEGTWNSKQKDINNTNTNATSASVNFMLTKLTENTTYEYYIVADGPLSARTVDDFGSVENPKTFTTKTPVEYEVNTIFPDEVFRQYIKKQTGIGTYATKITSDKLESLTRLELPRRNADGDIRSLAGIEYLVNLESIDFSGHAITDVGKLAELKNLTSLYLKHNDLTDLPDLSGMPRLSHVVFEGNLIAPEKISEEKLPPSVVADIYDWDRFVSDCHRGEVAAVFAPNYYKLGNSLPFLTRINGLKKDEGRTYTLSLAIDGKTVTGDGIVVNENSSSSNDDLYYIKDILADGIAIAENTPCEAKITLTDQYGNTWLEETETLTFTTYPAMKTEYIKPNAQNVGISVDYLPESYTEDQIDSVALADAAGNRFGTASYINAYTSSNRLSQLYRDSLGSFDDSIIDMQNHHLSCTVAPAKYLAAGEYHVVITCKDGSSYTVKNAVAVSPTPIVTDVSAAYYNNSYNSDSSDSRFNEVTYDNHGDDLYVSLRGINIDPAKIRPVFYDGDVTISALVNVRLGGYSEDDTQYIYKLKKLEKDTYWNGNAEHAQYTYRIEADPGYNFIDATQDKTISLHRDKDFVLFEHYNYKKGVYEVKVDSRIADGTKMSVAVYSDSSYDTCEGTAEDTVTGGMLALKFRNGNSIYQPWGDAYFKYTYTDRDGNVKSLKHYASVARPYNYSSNHNGAYSDTVRCHAQPLKELPLHVTFPDRYGAVESVTATISSAGNTVGDIITLTEGTAKDGYVSYTGTWSYPSGLAAGHYDIYYRIKAAKISGNLYSHDLYVYDDGKFYMEDQSAGIWADQNAKGISITFSSWQLAGDYTHKYNGKVSNDAAIKYWNEGGYRLELFDRAGNALSGWEINHASWAGENFSLYLTGLSAEYTGVYARISKGGTLGIRLPYSGETEKSYYANAYRYTADETHGQWHDLKRNNVWLNQDDELVNAFYGFGSYNYPVIVTITRPYDTDVIHTFTVEAPTDGRNYDFNETDLAQTEPNEVYQLSAVSTDGSGSSAIGYLAVKGGSVVESVDATGVTLNKTTLNMQLAQTETLTATVKPDNATNKNVTWSSDNDGVATVDGNGTVTAAGTGTAKITVTTHNGKTTSCTVQVYNYTLNHTSLQFDLSAEPDRTELLKVKDGTADISDITWSSTDESVVTVSKAGLVTPVGAGSAKILAAVKNGPTLTCDVTVSRNQLTGITLNTSSCTLYLDAQNAPVSQMPNTQQLKLFVTPNDATVASVTWTSDNPAVASVAENGNNPLAAVVTAHSRGAAKISATVATASGSETAVCEVSVKTVTTVEDANIPTGLTALTNEQLTLADVALPQGWTWHEASRSVPLKQFAGAQSKSFLAQYNDPQDADAKPFEKELSVAFTTVTGIAIGADSSSLQKGKSLPLSVLWNSNGAPLDLSTYGSRVAWSINKPAVAKLSAASGSEVTLNAVEAGDATVTAQIKFADNKLLKTQFKIKVTEEAPAAIQVASVDGFSGDAQQNHVYYSAMNTTDASNTGTIHVTVTGAEKLTLKNNNTKVIKADKPTAAAGGYSIPLTMKAAGMAKITLIANDPAKTQTEIRLHVSDARPNVSDTPVTINLQQTTGTVFALYPCTGYQVTDVKLMGSDAGKFTLNTDASPEQYVINAVSGTAKGTYKLTLQGTVKEGTKEYSYDNVPLTVKVVDQKPKFKIKQTAKVNLFYKNWENSRLTVTSEDTLERAELAGCDFTVENDNGAFVLKAKSEGLATNCNKKGTLTLHFSGYKPVTTNFTVGVEKKAPTCKFSSKTVTLYPDAGLNSAILNPTVYQPNGTSYPDVRYELDSASTQAGFSLMNDESGNMLIQYTGKGGQNKSYRTKFKLSHGTWTDALDVPFTVKVSKNKPAAKLAKATLQLNTNSASMAYDAASTAVMWKDGAAFTPAGVSVSAEDAKSQAVIQKGIVFQYDRERQQVIAKLNNTAVTPGSYKFKVNIRAADTLTVSTPLTVKVTNTAMDKAVKISAKGSIDVLNREGTYVTVTPSLKSLNGTVTGARLSGRAAHLFLAECKDGKVFIHAKQNAALITKYNYKVKLDLNIENAAGDSIRYMTPEINLKLKQGTPKAAVSPKSLTIYSGTSPVITRRITATLKGRETELPIENVELLNNTDAFQCEYTNAGNGPVITLRNTAETVKGKTYSLQLKVTFRGQADNERATVIRYSVKVK